MAVLVALASLLVPGFAGASCQGEYHDCVASIALPEKYCGPERRNFLLCDREQKAAEERCLALYDDCRQELPHTTVIIPDRRDHERRRQAPRP